MALIYDLKLNENFIDNCGNTFKCSSNLWTDGKTSEKAFKYDNSSYLTGPKEKINSNSFTLSYWAKYTNFEYPRTNSGFSKCYGYYNDKNLIGWEIGHGYSPSSFDITIGNQTNNSKNYKRQHVACNVGCKPIDFLNKWTHFAFVCDWESKKFLIYINGIKQTNYLDLTGLTDSPDSDAPLQIRSLHGWWPDASFNDVRFYNNALSSKEIIDLSRANILKYSLNNPYIEETKNLVNDTIQNSIHAGSTWGAHKNIKNKLMDAPSYLPFEKYSYSNFQAVSGGWCANFGAIDIDKSETNQYTYSIFLNYPKNIGYTNNYVYVKYYDKSSGWNLIKEMGVTKPNQYIDYSNGWRRYYGTLTPPANCNCIELLTFAYPICNEADNVILEYSYGGIQFEKNDHMTPFHMAHTQNDLCYDISSFDWNGTPHNVQIKKNSPCGEYCAYFNGIDSYIKSDYIIKDWTQNKSITFNFWMNPDDDNAREIFGTPNYSWVIFRNSNGTVGFNQWDNVGGHLNKMGVTSNTKALLNQWSMITVVWTGLVSKIYINGQLDNSREASFGKPNKTTTEKMNIGGNIYSWGKNSYFKGYLSNVSIYNDELTDAEILQLYEAKTIIDKSGNIYSSEFKEYGQELFTESFTGSKTSMDPDNFCNVITLGNAWINYNHGELLEIKPNCKYIFKIKVKTAAKNQVDIGFERYDEHKNTGINNSTFYSIVKNTGLNNSYEFDITNAVHENITLNDENKTVVPTKYIKFRGLNNWSPNQNKPDDPDPTYKLEFEVSLLEIPINQKSKVNKNGVFDIGVIDDYFLEYEKNKYCYINSPISINNTNKSKIYKNGIVNGNSFIER